MGVAGIVFVPQVFIGYSVPATTRLGETVGIGRTQSLALGSELAGSCTQERSALRRDPP